MLLVTAARLVDFKRLIYTLKASRYDAGLVIVTAFTGVAIDLDKSVLLGVILSILLFVPRAAKLKAKELPVTPERVVRERIPGDPPDPSIVIYDLEGELFFGAAPQLQKHLCVTLDEVDRGGIRYLILRLRGARHPDVVAIELLDQFVRDARQAGATVLLAGLSADFVKVLNNVGLIEQIGSANVFVEDDRDFSATLRAVRYAHGLIQGPILNDGTENDPAPPTYYLV